MAAPEPVESAAVMYGTWSRTGMNEGCGKDPDLIEVMMHDLGAAPS